MKALSLTQPWATLMAIGAKKIETRSWSTAYRGVVAIHASNGFPRWAREVGLEDPFRTVLQGHSLPLGAIVAVGRIVQVLRTGCIEGISEQERAFGDYESGRFGWFFTDIVAVHEPIKCKGALGLWTVSPELQEHVMALRTPEGK